MKFLVKNCNLFPIPGNNNLLHLGTIGYGLREFIVMAAIKGMHSGNVYIEEVVLNTIDFSGDVYANCKFIDDDKLAFDIARYAEEKDITNMKKRIDELIDRGKLSWIPGS